MIFAAHLSSCVSLPTDKHKSDVDIVIITSHQTVFTVGVVIPHKDLGAVSHTHRGRLNYLVMIIRPGAAQLIFHLWLNQYWLDKAAAAAAAACRLWTWCHRSHFLHPSFWKLLRGSIDRDLLCCWLILVSAAWVDSWGLFFQYLQYLLPLGGEWVCAKEGWWRPLHNWALSVDPGPSHSFDWKD